MRNTGFRLRTATGVAVVILLIMQGLSAAAPTATDAPDGLSVTELRVESSANPLGLDVAEPRFSWQLRAQARGVVQSAYQVLVASDPDLLAAGEGDVWDSGRAEARQATHVPYAGPALQPQTRYHWAVRVWDHTGAVSAWSGPAWFETGLLDRPWDANWITSERATMTAPVDRRSLRDIPFFGPRGVQPDPRPGLHARLHRRTGAAERRVRAEGLHPCQARRQRPHLRNSPWRVRAAPQR
jgi:hypothetical protein